MNGPGQRRTRVHIDAKIGTQLGARGWTEQPIRKVVDTPPIGISVDNTGAKAEPATVNGSTNRGYVVVNDLTGRVIQISDKNNPRWIPDDRIERK